MKTPFPVPVRAPASLPSSGPPSAGDGTVAGTVLLVGAGRMGAALAGGWLAAGLDPKNLAVVEPGPGAENLAKKGATVVARAADLPRGVQPDALVIAVKPQVVADILPAYRHLAARAVTISIAAGTTVSFLETALGGGAVVRAMPNTPAAIGRGITAAFATTRVTPAQRVLADALLRAGGAVVWLEDETLLDAVTAVSGSGPAYVFHLVEALADAGAAAGLDPETASTLARATVTGAGALLDATGRDAGDLRRDVTSPGGTTEAALGELMDPERGLAPLLRRAVLAARARARALGR